ncbi:MAG TPA: hypothetical protein VGP16_01720 [Asanoa sp.]|jgi:hypothetical protein|nr:hypothetical protein [Asanoa sp.]
MTVHEQRDDAPDARAARKSGLSMPETRPDAIKRGWLQNRRKKVIEEIDRNRRGDYRVPTWVLAVLLVAVLAGWLLLIFLNG